MPTPGRLFPIAAGLTFTLAFGACTDEVSRPPQAPVAADLGTWRCGLEDASTLSPGTSSDEVLGTQTVLFIRADTSDLPGEPVALAAAQALFDQVALFYAQGSFGGVSLTTTITPVLRLPLAM